MNKQILDVVKAVSYEMEVDKEVIVQAIESAMEIATKKRHLGSIDVRVEIDRETGDSRSFRRWTVIDPESPDLDEEFEFDPEIHLTPEQARARDANLKPGDVVEEPMESVEFGRIAAQTAKQVIVQKVREAKRAKIVDAFKGRLGELISGVVKRASRDGIILDLGDNAEAYISREDMIPGEMVRNNDRLRALLYEVNPDARGPQLLASRSKKEMLIELFRIEVPEIGEEIIEIKAVARDPGLRSKIAVKTNDGRIDPIGACVGMRGSRVQVISNELNGERIDIILWDDNPAQLVINAMAPAEVASIVMDEDRHVMDIAVEEEQLSQAIGRNGQNVRLASELTGWTINLMSTADAANKNKVEAEKIQKIFMEKLDVDTEIAAVLTREGFTTLEEIVYVPIQELLNVEEFDEEIVEALRERAQEALEQQEAQGPEPAEDLLAMKGMDEELARVLAKRGIVTMEDLADLSVDELTDIEGLTKERASQLIMTAREPWFK